MESIIKSHLGAFKHTEIRMCHLSMSYFHNFLTKNIKIFGPKENKK